MEAPFSDKEKRFVLSEVIKTSSIPVEKLLAFINESEVQPIWPEILMPFGRNLNSCINVWDTLRAGPRLASASLQSVPTLERKRKPDVLELPQPVPQPKRRQSGADTMIRIQPKPSSNGSPQAFSTPPVIQPKKRGRPSKADVEARNAAAIARGEVIAPPRTPAAKESVGGIRDMTAVTPIVPSGPVSSSRTNTAFQGGPSDNEPSDMVGKKKRGRPGSRSSKEPNQGEGSFSAFGPSSGSIDMSQQPPAPKLSTEGPSQSRPSLPKPEEGGFGAPVYPAIDALLSPEPPRPERSDA